MNKLLCLMGWHDWEKLPAWSCWSGLCNRCGKLHDKV